MTSPTIDEEIADLREAIEIVQSNIEEGRYDKAEQKELLYRHRVRLNELMVLKTSPDEMEKAFGHVVVIVIAIAISLIVIVSAIAGGLVGYDIGLRDRDAADYRERVDFCHDRMKNDDVKSEWRQMYCRKSDRRK